MPCRTRVPTTGELPALLSRTLADVLAACVQIPSASSTMGLLTRCGAWGLSITVGTLSIGLKSTGSPGRIFQCLRGIR